MFSNLKIDAEFLSNKVKNVMLLKGREGRNVFFPSGHVHLEGLRESDGTIESWAVICVSLLISFWIYANWYLIISSYKPFL